MEEYLSFHKVLDLLQQFQESNPRLNSFGYGNLVDFGKNVSGTTVVYPFLFIVPLSIQYDQNTTTYQLTAIFADRLNEDLSNEKDCVSDMSLCARQLLSEILRGSLFNYFETTLPAQAQPFMERFNDNVAGVALDLYVQIFEDINACPQYPVVTPSLTPTGTPGASPTPTPSITPTITITPSVTTTMTLTPTNSPSVTPTLTPTFPTTPSVTPSFTPTLTPTITPTCESVNRYVAVGTDSYAVYGRDGITYSASTIPSGITIVSDVDYYNGRFVAVGRNATFNGNPIIYSDDYGQNWSFANTSFTGQCSSIATNGSIWVTCQIGVGIKTSTNGVDWTGATISIPNTTQRDITWNGSMFVSAGNVPLYSYDGLSWSAATIPSGFTDAQEAQYNGNRWVMVGNGNPRVINSTDGITWSASSISNSATTLTSYVSTVMWSGTKWYIAGYNTTAGHNVFAQSTDGVTFSGFSVTIPSSSGLNYACDRMIYDGNNYLISTTTPGGMKPLYYSNDALTYTACNEPAGITVDSISLYSIPQPFLQPPVYNCFVPPVTPSLTPSVTMTSTPAITPSITPTKSPVAFTGLTFTVGSGSTRPESCNNLNSGNTITVYAADLGNCGPCLPLTCWPCISTGQQVYLDQAFTIPVPNGYYANLMQAPSNIGVWYIVGGFPQPAGFGGCA